MSERNETNLDSLHETNIVGEHSDNLVDKFSKRQFIYSLVGLIVGLLSILGGILLFILGISGNISWTANLLGAKSKVMNAAPGGLLFVVGVFVIFLTRYKLNIKK